MSGSKLVVQPTLAWRAILVGTAGTSLAFWQHQQDNLIKDRRQIPSQTKFSYSQTKEDLRGPMIPLSIEEMFSSTMQRLFSAAARAERTQMEARDFRKARGTEVSPSFKQYDFVIIGNGNTGQSALVELRKQCPGATIALVDPMRAEGKGTSKTDYFPQLAASMDPKSRLVRLLNGNAKETTLSYKYAALIATGAHGSPPPNYLVDQQAWPYVLELRPTMYPHLLKQLKSQYDRATLDSPKRPLQHHYTAQKSTMEVRKFLHPTQSRQLVVRAAQQGQAVGILGRGWDALDLAIACSTPSTTLNRKSTQQRRRKDIKNRPTLLYGGNGPLSHVLPQYLSVAVSKRLRSRGIQIQDRALVRYVSYDDRARKLGVYTAKAFDVLDSQRVVLDWLIVAPEVSASRGNALVPTHNVPLHLQESGGGRCWYENWSQLARQHSSEDDDEEEPPMLICYNGDGRIAVNAELCACTGVYAAGSVAKSGNAFTGDAQVAGGGVVNATLAGQVAASNMARHYHEPVTVSSFSYDAVEHRPPLAIRLNDPVPVWRSDVLSYDQNTPSSLSTVGITALCVGTCDSERLTTHGVFWTNQAAQLRFMQEFTNIPDDKLKELAKEQVRKSVYGIGVVYYLDYTGRVQGIMAWGLPISSDNQSKKLNDKLVRQMKDILKSDKSTGLVPGAVETLALFTELSQELARTAYSVIGATDGDVATKDHRLNLFQKGQFPRPLHRYTPVWMTNLAFRKKRHQHHGIALSQGSGGIMGEDLFARSFLDGSHVPDQLPVKPVAGVGFSDPSNPAFQASQNMYEYQIWERKEKRWEENEVLACPPKEDALWIRKGHEDRVKSALDQQNEDFARVLQRRYSQNVTQQNTSTSQLSRSTSQN